MLKLCRRNKKHPKRIMLWRISNGWYKWNVTRCGLCRISVKENDMFNEKGYNIDNLIILRDRLTENKDNLNLYMENFVKDNVIREKHSVDCGTPACIVGHAAGKWFDVMEDEIRGGKIEYFTFSERVFHNNWADDEWDFLFGYDWSNSVEEAIGRLNYVIEHGDCPDEWEYTDSFSNG